MSWHDDSKHPFAGIAEKLKRADQNILNLQSEIEGFIQSGKYPVIPNPQGQERQEALAYHRNKVIPLRFSVLAGEAVHHLRSSLDHIVWHFSSATYKASHEGAIEFPVFKDEPLSKDEIGKYKRKIEGITNAKVLFWINELQPYKARANAADNSLLIIHNMDRFDKHRELVIVDSSAEISFPLAMEELWRKAELYSQEKLPESEHLAFSQALKDYGKVIPGVAFREFGKRKTYPVIKGLVELWDDVNHLAALFATQV